MKLNPFRRKTNGYFDKIKADYAERTRELEALRREVAEAKTAFEDARQTLFEVEQKSNSTVWSRREQELLRQKNAAEHHYNELRTRLGHLELDHRSLRWKAEAPDALAQRIAELKVLATRRQQIEAERDKQRGAIAKLEARIATLRGEIDQETESATQALIESGGDTPGASDALVKRRQDLKLLAEAVAKVRQQEAALESELGSIPAQERELRRCIESDQASVAEIDLHEQMPEFIQLIARAAVSKARVHGGNRHTYEIQIPETALEAATASLDAEIRSD
ncbi:hypothetical protein [Accumulibacter sp.]|uniref:hypothetical protein n=1 Tax=Accumulibacter sp. TaxID=2053492 RepID=UPI001AC14BAD|nr:hypothetical protein [Accumulibacter sp.]MBN8454079.1 hypothetical protein [Accumulibacter sp.]MBO3708659.1 hypothetical protein [Candidatus Accumulibacter conexus]